jgi:hypothetical protein
MAIPCSALGLFHTSPSKAKNPLESYTVQLSKVIGKCLEICHSGEPDDDGDCCALIIHLSLRRGSTCFELQAREETYLDYLRPWEQDELFVGLHLISGPSCDLMKVDSMEIFLLVAKCRDLNIFQRIRLLVITQEYSLHKRGWTEPFSTFMDGIQQEELLLV